MKEDMIREYEYLRDEINQKMGLHNSLLMFMITTVVAILTVAFSEQLTYMYLLPFCIIIPISMRIAYYISAMTKLSGYMVVFLENEIEGLNWETRNSKIIKPKKVSFIHKICTLRYYEGILLGTVCYSLFVIDYLNCNNFNLFTLLNIVLPLFLLIWEILITKKIISVDEERIEWIERWINYKNAIKNEIQQH